MKSQVILGNKKIMTKQNYRFLALVLHSAFQVDLQVRTNRTITIYLLPSRILNQRMISLTR